MTLASGDEPASQRQAWRVVDASVWVSRYVPDDAHHPASYTWLYQHLSGGRIVVAPTLLLVDVAGALVRRTGDAARTTEIVRRLRQLPNVRWLPLTAGVRDHAALLATVLRLRGADAIYVAVADRLGIPLVTWDVEQLTRARSRIVALTPLSR